MMIRQVFTLLLLVILFCSCEKKTTSDGAKVFRYNQSGGLTSLDPAFANKQANSWATAQIYNGLISLNEGLFAVPELAESYKISENGLTYTFVIRSGVRFHDSGCFPKGEGRNLRAKDFVYSFKRILDKNTASPGYWIFEDKVFRGPDGNISDTCFVAVNDTILRIHLKEKSPIFLQILAMPYAYVVPEEAVKQYGKDFRSKPVGTGPFRIKEWIERTSLILEKNSNYWKKDDKGVTLPYLDGIEVSFNEDPNVAFLNFQDGKLDFFSGLTDNALNQVLNKKDGSVQEKFKSKFQVEKADYISTEYIGFFLEGDEKANPFTNLKVRQALSYAVNRDELVTFMKNGLGTPGNNGFVPKALPSYDTSKVRGYPYNLKKAQALLEEAGYPSGKGFPKITLNTFQSDKEVASYLQNEWKKLGINIEIEMKQFAAHQQSMDKGEFKFFRANWLGDYPDAENFLRLFYGKKDNFAPSGTNKTHYTNSKFDELFVKAPNIDNTFERYDTYNKMDSLMMVDAPVIILYYAEVLQLRQNNIVGMKPNKINSLSLERVDKKEPEQNAKK